MVAANQIADYVYDYDDDEYVSLIQSSDGSLTEWPQFPAHIIFNSEPGK